MTLVRRTRFLRRQLLTTCSALFGDAVSTLQGLLKTVPAFWGTDELSQIVLLYLDQHSSASNADTSKISTLIKSLAKKIPPKNLIPALLEMWDPLQGSKIMVGSNYRVHPSDPMQTIQSRITAFFVVFGGALQHADRPTVLEHLRDIFKVFLEALDTVKTHDEVSSIQHTLPSALNADPCRLNPASFMHLEKWS